MSAFTAAVLTTALVPGCEPGQPGAESQPVFFSHLVDAKTIAGAGKAYLAAYPNENDADTLKTILMPRNGQLTNTGSINRSLIARIKDDFNTNRTVTVGGWILAATEARQCALFYLLQS